jgi:hypothetical protein
MKMKDIVSQKLFVKTTWQNTLNSIY